MNMLNINLSDYRERFSPQLPPGRYSVIVDHFEQGVAKSSGNTKITLWLRITEGPHRDAVLVDNLTITAAALFRVVAFMQAIGLPTPRQNLQVNLKTWLNKRLQVDVEDGEPYKGRVKSEVRGYLRLTDNGDTDAAPADLSDLETEPAEVVVPDSTNAGGGEPEAAPAPATGGPQTLSLDDIDLS